MLNNEQLKQLDELIKAAKSDKERELYSLLKELDNEQIEHILNVVKGMVKANEN